MAFGLRSAGAQTVVFNRTEAGAREVAEQFGGGLDDVGPDFDVVVNATSVGMGDPAAPSPAPETALENRPVVFDIVARPRETTLIRQAQARGAAVVHGISMVAHQAVPALEWLTGVRPDLSLLRASFA